MFTYYVCLWAIFIYCILMPNEFCYIMLCYIFKEFECYNIVYF